MSNTLRPDMIAVLKDSHTKEIAFQFGAVAVGTSGFLDVAAAIRNKSILVVYNSSMPRDAGRYLYKPRNKFTMGFGRVGADTSRMALIVHEAVHAIFDLGKKKLKVKDSEAAAYLAQALYFYHAWGYGDDDTLTAPEFTNPILTAAWPMAEKIAKSGTVDETLLADLYKKIDEHPDYHGRLEADEDFDG